MDTRHPQTFQTLLSLLYLHTQYPYASHLQVDTILSAHTALNDILDGDLKVSFGGIMGTGLRIVSDQVEMWQERGRRGERVERVLQEFIDVIETLSKYEENGGLYFKADNDDTVPKPPVIPELPDTGVASPKPNPQNKSSPPKAPKAPETQPRSMTGGYRFDTKKDYSKCRITDVPWDIDVSECSSNTLEPPSSPLSIPSSAVFNPVYRSESSNTVNEFLGSSIRVDQFFDLLLDRLNLFSDTRVTNGSIIRFHSASPTARSHMNTSRSFNDFITAIVEQLSVQEPPERSASTESTELPTNKSPVDDGAGQQLKRELRKCKLEGHTWRSLPGVGGWFMPPTPKQTSDGHEGGAGVPVSAHIPAAVASTNPEKKEEEKKRTAEERTSISALLNPLPSPDSGGRHGDRDYYELEAVKDNELEAEKVDQILAPLPSTAPSPNAPKKRVGDDDRSKDDSSKNDSNKRKIQTIKREEDEEEEGPLEGTMSAAKNKRRRQIDGNEEDEKLLRDSTPAAKKPRRSARLAKKRETRQ